MATERAYWLAWSRLKGIGPVTLKHLWERFGQLEAAWYASPKMLLEVDGIGLLSAEKIAAQRPEIDPEKLLDEHESDNRAFWTPADADYPALLFAINDPPPVLYYRGALRLNEVNALSVGIVGTRRPSSYGRRWTQRLSGRLAQQGVVVVSGLAAGIDAVAHASCLQHGGLTVAVLGTGVDVAYPLQNRRLQMEIAEKGLVISEYPDGTGPDKTHFPRRNRIIAGLSRALMVTEAPTKSGSLITSRLANEYCREVYALPCDLDNAQGAGNLNLIVQGAQLIVGEQSLIDALSELPPVDDVLPQTQLSQRQPSQTQSGKSQTQSGITQPEMTPTSLSTSWATDDSVVPELSPMMAQVLGAVSMGPTILDHIVQITQMETGQVLAALVQLELLGLVTQLPGMQYQRG
ncbi:MAG: DNA-processing protein DprA [Cyanobacteria bacterium P01_D01_bin.105]